MDASLGSAEGRAVVRIERRFRHPPERVWRALTEPAGLSAWFPADVTGDFRVGGTLHFTYPDGKAPPSDGVVTAFDPPRLFAFRWNRDRFRWEVWPDGDGALLVLTHAFEDRPGAASFTAGWTVGLDALDARLDGRPAPPADWAGLHERYVAEFGLDAGTAEDTPDGGWRVRFERQLTRPPDAVWAALAGHDTLPGFPAGAVVDEAEPARREYEWLAGGTPAGRVRYVLSPGPGGARLVLTHTGPAGRDDLREAALAGWRAAIGALAARLQSSP